MSTANSGAHTAWRSAHKQRITLQVFRSEGLHSCYNACQHRFDANPGLQDLYMMEAKSPALQQISDSLPWVSGVSFSQDSQFFIVAGQDEECPSETYYLLYSRSGQIIRTICDERNCSYPSWALVAGNQLASAQIACFKIWDPSLGQAVATAGPDLAAVQDRYNDGDGQLAAKRAGSKLAFCPALLSEGGHMVHVYDVATLQLLARLRPEVGALPAEPQSRNSEHSQLFWGVHGWVLAYRPIEMQPRVMGHLQVMVPQAGCDTYRQVIMRGCQPSPAALSPDGAFVALFAAEGAKLEIRAVCSGQLMLTRAVGVPRNVQAHAECWYDTSIQWTSSGRMVARVSANGWMYRCLCERILVVKFV